MRLLRSLICACAAASVIALKDEDPIILFGSQSRQSSGSKIPSLSPTAARLVLAKQLGLDQYHSLRDVDQETIDALNSHGSRWSGLLEESEKNHPRTLLYLDGLEITQNFIKEHPPAFTISGSPSSDSSRRLIEDFLVQGSHAQGSASVCSFDSWGVSYVKGGMVRGSTLASCDAPIRSNLPANEKLSTSLERIAEIYDPASRLYTSNNGESLVVVHISMQELIKAMPNEPKNAQKVYTEVSEALFRLIANADEQTTIVIVPNPHSTKPSRTPFGTYDVPSLLSRRQLPEEEPLFLAPKVASSSTSSKSSSPTSSPLPLNSTTPVNTMLPVCHPDNRTCFAATNGCSSHGSCTLLYTIHKSADEGKGAECWACACKPTVVKNKLGTQTTRWAGPACQKKDISSNFFLLAGLSIALVGLATWGVGLMYSIGEEELPSVIGAGVAGPRAQK